MTRLAHVLVAALVVGATLAIPTGCSSGPQGQTSFTSAPPAGGLGGAKSPGGVAGGVPGYTATDTSSARAVEETDLYRLDGDRLYYLSSYRGLMVFDVHDVDHPRLLGRSAVYGDPVEMVVRDGLAVVVVADWYGALDDGTPFHGSLVRGLDTTDPAHIRVLGEAKLGGWVRDTRVVGDVLYAVSEDYGWVYGWGAPGGVATGGVAAASTGGASRSTATVIVSSVSFAGRQVRAIGRLELPGQAGIFHVTPEAILLAHDAIDPGSDEPWKTPVKTELRYLDIRDPGGQIVARGALTVDGRAQGWGADNGRWNLDFADGKTARVIGCAGPGYCGDQAGYLLTTVDFSQPDAPVQKSALAIPGTGWSVAARFDHDRLYLSPDSYSYQAGGGTPLQIYDLAEASAPKLAGAVTIPGTVWNLIPAPASRLFALGNDWTDPGGYGQAVSLKYLDVSDPAHPRLLGTSTFGEGWAWTPAAGTFKAFTMDAQKGLVVLPFSGWSERTLGYNNGLQLVEVTLDSVRTAGAARTRGWVERGVFVRDRLISLSDVALSVIDYADHAAPRVTAELTLARNVVAAQPGGDTIVEVSSDWWDHDVSTSEVRVLPLANAEETTDAVDGTVAAVTVDGVNARVFRSGALTYVVSSARVPRVCAGGGSGCYGRAQQVQVVDTSLGGARLRGRVRLPVDEWGWYGRGWAGCFWWDWFDGAEVVQVGSDALAVRRWQPVFDASGSYLDQNSLLYVVDLANPDAPAIASVVVTRDPDGWWGNLRVVGDTLYTTHYEWLERAADGGVQPTVRYYVDRVDLADRAHPKIGARVNVPGLLVGGSAADPSLLYTIDYRWEVGAARNDFDVVRLVGDVAVLQSRTPIEGWIGATFVRGDRAYLSAQRTVTNGSLALHAIDLSDPARPIDRVASDRSGWGWLLAVEGDRAIVTSGWGYSGVDIYTLSETAPPRFTQFARTRGWWANEITRQGSALFLSSGYWGVQRIDLQP